MTYLHNKACVIREVKAAVRRKRAACFDGDKEKIQTAHTELEATIKQGQRKYKERVEGQMSSNNTRGLWKGMKSVSVRLMLKCLPKQQISKYMFCVWRPGSALITPHR